MKAILFLTLVLLAAPGASAQIGTASWYSTEACQYNSNPRCPTASGRSLYELEREGKGFAASYDYPIGTVLRVCNQANKRCVNVEILDRGPARRLERIIDLSKQSFQEIANSRLGVIQVTVKQIHA